MITASAAYRNAVANFDRSLATVARSPQVSRETEYYLAHIENVKSVDNFVGNRRLLAFALKAYGLSDLNYATAFIRRLLEGGIDDSQALANRMSDQRYRDFVAAFNFKRYGATATTFDRTRKGTSELYARQALEENTGSQNEGARLALYFRRKASSISTSFHVLADSALLKVVQTATGLTPYMSNLDIDTQSHLIASKVDVADFKDPVKLDRFLNRFTAIWDVNNASTPTAASLGALDFSSPVIGPDLISAIQQIRARF